MLEHHTGLILHGLSVEVLDEERLLDELKGVFVAFVDTHEVVMTTRNESLDRHLQETFKRYFQGRELARGQVYERRTRRGMMPAIVYVVDDGRHGFDSLVQTGLEAAKGLGQAVVVIPLSRPCEDYKVVPEGTILEALRQVRDGIQNFIIRNPLGPIQRIRLFPCGQRRMKDLIGEVFCPQREGLN